MLVGSYFPDTAENKRRKGVEHIILNAFSLSYSNSLSSTVLLPHTFWNHNIIDPINRPRVLVQPLIHPG